MGRLGQNWLVSAHNEYDGALSSGEEDDGDGGEPEDEASGGEAMSEDQGGAPTRRPHRRQADPPPEGDAEGPSTSASSAPGPGSSSRYLYRSLAADYPAPVPLLVSGALPPWCERVPNRPINYGSN